MPNAIICIDFINEIVGASGKLAGKGYRDFVTKHNTLVHLAEEQAVVRSAGGHVFHVHLGFAPDYSDHPKSSPLLGGAMGAGILKLDTPSTEIMREVAPYKDDIVLVKKRISAFYGTDLERKLRELNIDKVLIAGVATDLAVQSAARDAHDRDFEVEILSNCCAAANEADHNTALNNMKKFAAVR